MATYQLPDGRTVSTDMAFTLDDIQYPNNWLALSTPEDREQRGIEGPLPEPAWYDQRFYWGPDLPKDHGQLVEQYSEYVRMNANAILRETDWMVVRESDNGTPVDLETKALRQEIRLAAGEKVAAIEATADTEALAAYITSSDYNQWPPYPEPEPEGPTT
jgi:hypothetical protein